jgi:hypothetical protein
MMQSHVVIVTFILQKGASIEIPPLRDDVQYHKDSIQFNLVGYTFAQAQAYLKDVKVRGFPAYGMLCWPSWGSPRCRLASCSSCALSACAPLGHRLRGKAQPVRASQAPK